MNRWALLTTAAFAVAGCGVSDAKSECQKTCEAALKCGFLPSPLGPADESSQLGVESCAARCANTDTDTRGRIQGCLRPVAESQTDGSDWKATINGRGDSLCLEAARCLEELYPGVPVLGQAALAVSVRARLRPRPDAGKTTCGPSATHDAGLDAATRCESDPSFCDRLGKPTVTVSIERYSHVERERQFTCTEALANEIHFQGLTPGLAVPKVTVLGALRSDRDGGGAVVPFCRTFEGAAVELSAAKERDAIVEVDPDFVEPTGTSPAAGSACELGPLLCSNGIDDDENGLPDCRDPACQCTAPVVDAGASSPRAAETGAP